MVLFNCGCGYIGGVQPPLANIPQNPAELSVVQRGGLIFAHVKVPEMTTELVAIKDDLELDLRAGVTPDPWSEAAWLAKATKVPVTSVKDGVASYEFPAMQWTGKDITVAARAIGPNGKPSGWSNVVGLPIVAPMPKVTGVVLAPTAKGIRVTWRGEGKQFRILRETKGVPGFTEVGTSTMLEFLDATAEFGKTYAYLVQSFADLGDHREAQGDLSDAAVLLYKDTFPPAAPADVRATSSAASVELSWDANSEPDIAGYRVYRSADGGAFTKIADVSEIPAYSDRDVQRGKTYRYSVTAIDKDGNESDKSPPVEATL